MLKVRFLTILRTVCYEESNDQIFEKSNKNLTAERIELIQTQIERSTCSLSVVKINKKKFF
jgi:hypothetical protein